MSNGRRRALVVSLFAGMLCAACSKKAGTGSAPAASVAKADTKKKGDPAAEAKKIFQQRCVVCHGNTGNGDGPGSASLDPKPRKFKDAKWQESVTDDHLKTVILKGGAAVGKSPVMPDNPDLKGKPDVITELAKIVRGFKS